MNNKNQEFFNEEDLDNAKLSELFNHGWKIQRDLCKILDETSEKFLVERKKCIHILKKCEFMLDELHLFSDNENLEEVSSSELRYFLNYVLLGWLYSKVNSNKPDIRIEELEQSIDYFFKYLKLTRNYELHNLNFESQFSQNENNKLDVLSNKDKQAAFDSNLINMANERNEKIRRYKEQREIEKQLETMSLTLDLCPERVDEEDKRKTYLTFIKYWINKCLDDLKLVDDELKILKSINFEKKSNPEQKKQFNAIANENQPKKPFIITKNALQAKVFGAGYPSLPVYSVEEFYDHLAEEGKMPKANEPSEVYHPVKIGGGVTDSQKEKEKAEKDRLDDLNDEGELKKQREWDEFKDENKRGAGNTYNRS